MRRAYKAAQSRLAVVVLALLASFAIQHPALAQPFGAGVYGADVPFGDLTSVAINISDPIDLTLLPSGGNFSGNDSHTVTITSTDVVGYQLFVKATSTTALTQGANTIATSANSSPTTLAVNSWGYNTTSSTNNFRGMTLSDVLIKNATGPHKSGDATIFTYGALVDMTKPSGTYTVNVTYTAIGQS